MRHPQLTEPAFRRLLVWLDGSVDSQGETYLEVRRRLIAYFDRGNCASPDELADETFNRVASTLEQSGTIAVTPPARYCYVVARSVFLDDVRGASPHVSAAARADRLVATSRDGEAGAFATREQRLECLDRCLNALDPAQRALIVEYYRADGRDADRRTPRARGAARPHDDTRSAVAPVASGARSNDAWRNPTASPRAIAMKANERDRDVTPYPVEVQNMMMRAAVILLTLGMMTGVSARERDFLARFDGGIGVIPVSNAAGVVNTVRGVQPAPGPWRIGSLRADIDTYGRVKVRGRGLLLANGNLIGTNAQPEGLCDVDL